MLIASWCLSEADRITSDFIQQLYLSVRDAGWESDNDSRPAAMDAPAPLILLQLNAPNLNVSLLTLGVRDSFVYHDVTRLTTRLLRLWLGTG